MVKGLVQDWNKVELPKMVRVKQKFTGTVVEDIRGELRNQFDTLKLAERLKPGAKIAVAVGSRGIHAIDKITKEVIDLLKDNNFDPFIIPAMGSHGGATAEGQKELLAGYGITEETMGVSIQSSLDVVEVASVKVPQVPEEFPVYVDKIGFNSDGIVVINRVKPHTLFRNDVESGLMKMLTIGLGKHQGATKAHLGGFDIFNEIIPAVGKKILENAPIYFGVGIVENAFEETSEIRVVPREDFVEADRALLIKARELMGRIQIPELDCLIVKEIGKEYSGDGMDPNVTGRYLNPQIKPDIKIQKIVVLDLSAKTEGNACGVGMADVITKRLFDKINFKKTYINVYTSTALHGGRIPMIIDTDEEALQVALTSCVRISSGIYKIAYIPNTLCLEELWVSEALAEELKDSPNFEIMGDPEAIEFDTEGNIINLPF
ncbi:MAG: lactate racemase domain-containing protein [Peptococcales bacterium]